MSSGTGVNQGDARPTVFLSYSRADEAHAKRLAQALEQAGLQVWWDSLIEGGEAFAKSIEAATIRTRNPAGRVRRRDTRSSSPTSAS